MIYWCLQVNSMPLVQLIFCDWDHIRWKGAQISIFLWLLCIKFSCFFFVCVWVCVCVGIGMCIPAMYCYWCISVEYSQRRWYTIIGMAHTDYNLDWRKLILPLINRMQRFYYFWPMWIVFYSINSIIATNCSTPVHTFVLQNHLCCHRLLRANQQNSQIFIPLFFRCRIYRFN